MEEQSILLSIKHMLFGIDADDITDFDSDLIVFINSSLATVYQLGVGDKPVSIKGENESWSDVITSEKHLETIKEFVYLDVKLVFDPPTSSIVMEALKEMKTEDEWRIKEEIAISDDV